ncbi:MAG: response regulator [Litorimonas sp.]
MKVILVVEDDPFIASDLQTLLEDLGHEILGPTAGVRAALEIIQTAKPDFALLDVNVLDGLTFPIAKRLKEDGTPYVFITGRPDLVANSEFRDAPVIQKPFSMKQIEKLLKS